MQRRLIAIMAALVLSTALAVPLASQDITVTPGPRGEQAFVAKVSSDLNRELGHVYLSPRDHASGLAMVHFRIGAQGRVTDVKLHHRSGDFTVNRVALAAVRRLDNLGAVPVGYPDDQIMQANIILATSERDLNRLNRQLDKLEAARINQAARSGGHPVLAFTVKAHSAS